MRVLIVEDEVRLAETLRDLLELERLYRGRLPRRRERVWTTP